MAVAVEVVAVVMMMMMKERKAACSLVVRIERMIARAKEGAELLVSVDGRLALGGLYWIRAGKAEERLAK